MIQSGAGKSALAGKGRLALMKQVMPMMRRIMDDCWIAAQDAQCVIYHPKVLAGYHIAEKLDVPSFLAMALPAYSPTQVFANPILGCGNYGAWLNRLSYSAALKAVSLPYRNLINAFRKEKLNLPKFNGDDLTLHGKPIFKLYGYSTQVLPSPADWATHWEANTHVTGYWFLSTPDDWQPPQDLVAFLAHGPAPIYIGFGSMATNDAAATTQMVLEAVKRSGRRAILASGWGGLAEAGLGETAHRDDVFRLDAAPHDWLFPRCAAVVHHGGAGTTAAGLHAGKPTLIVSFIGDQPFWGRRVHALGVGPQFILHKKLNVELLTAGLRKLVTDTTLAQRAQKLGEQLRAEDGVGRAVEIIGASVAQAR